MSATSARLNRYRQIAGRARAIPGLYGLRPYTVAIIVANWTGDYVGAWDEFDDRAVPIVETSGQPPKVAFDSEDPLVKGKCVIGPITPPYPGGGTALETLVRRVLDSQESYVRITGPNYPDGANFAVTQVHTDHALHWTLDCEHSDFQPQL